MLKVSAMNIHFQQQEKTGHYGIKMPGGGGYILYVIGSEAKS